MRVWLASIGCFAMIAPAAAQNAPTFLIGGEMAHTASSPTCFVTAGYSTFQRNLSYPPFSGTRAVITFPPAYCSGKNYTGTAVMTFKSSTSGEIVFKRLPATPQQSTETLQGSTGTPQAPASLPFVEYSEKHTPGTGNSEIVVNFEIPALFPVNLTLEQSSP